MIGYLYPFFNLNIFISSITQLIFQNIGRRLNHVKENDLANGQFMEWCDSKVNMTSKQANKFIKIADEFSNWNSTTNLGVEALYLIATLPEEEKQAQLEKVEQGDNPTVRELQEVRNL